MEKAINKKGFIQGLQDIITNVGVSQVTNSKDILKSILASTGVIFTSVDSAGNPSDDLKVTDDGTGSGFFVSIVGTGSRSIDSNYDVIEVVATQTGFAYPTAAGNYNVVIEYKSLYESSEDVPYDATYSSDGHAYEHKGFEIKTLAADIAPGNTQIWLAQIQYDGTTYTLVDKRLENQCQLKDPLYESLLLAGCKPAGLRLTTGMMQDRRSASRMSKRLLSTSRAYITAKWGDVGTGTVGAGNKRVLNVVTMDYGSYTVNMWLNHYVIVDGVAYAISSNTANTVTVASDLPVGPCNFAISPNAKAYLAILEPLDGGGGNPVGHEEQIAMGEASDYVQMEKTWIVEPDVFYRCRVTSISNWNMKARSEWSAWVQIRAGGNPFGVATDDAPACVDIVQNLSVSAKKDGMEVSVDIAAAYVSKIGGIEICWTESDAESSPATPDFGNSAHARQFIGSEKRKCKIPVAAGRKIKVAARAVDKAARICATPVISGIETSTQLALADISDARSIAEIEDEISTARGTYATVDSRIAAILGGTIDWGYVRIVAKSGGQYTTIQAALNSVDATTKAAAKFHLILIMPDGDTPYLEDVVIQDNTVVGFLGFGDVRIIGSISYTGTGECRYLGNLRLYNDTQDVLPLDVRVGLKSHRATIFENISVYQNNGTSGDAAKINVLDYADIIMRNTYLKSSKGNGLTFVTPGAASVLKVEMDACGFETYDECIDVNLSIAAVYLRLYDTCLKPGDGATYSIIKTAAGSFKLVMAHCRYVKLPDEANIDEDYGTIEAGKVTNVKYDAADLEVLS